ncbi:hypothetical protein KKB18_12350, partial [bacterium]|nr:hypothetical protein [bacterium]
LCNLPILSIKFPSIRGVSALADGVLLLNYNGISYHGTTPSGLACHPFKEGEFFKTLFIMTTKLLFKTNSSLFHRSKKLFLQLTNKIKKVNRKGVDFSV